MASLIQGGTLLARKLPGPSLLQTTIIPGAAMGAVALFENITGARFDPAPAYLFFVELEGLMVGLFTECSGIEAERKVEEIEEGGVNNYTHKLPGRVKYSNIILKRGLSLNRQLWDWFWEESQSLNVRRINMSIVQGAPGHNLITAISGAITGAQGGSSGKGQFIFQAAGQGFGKVKHWDIEKAFPVKWKGPSLSASSTSVAIEEIEIAHHGIDLSWEAGTPMSPVGSIVGAIGAALS